MKPILAYWDFRGRANPHRMLLHYAGVDFEDKRYTDPQEWFQKDKIMLEDELDFPNLPYYLDDDVKLTHGRAILEYLARKHGLDGKDTFEQARMCLILEQLWDLWFSLGLVLYPPKVENRKEIHDSTRKEYMAALPAKLGAISKFLGSSDWMGGKGLTYVDFVIYDILDFQRRLFLPKHLAKFPNLAAYLNRFEGLKGVREFLKSESFQPLPVSSYTYLGNTADYQPTE